MDDGRDAVIIFHFRVQFRFRRAVLRFGHMHMRSAHRLWRMVQALAGEGAVQHPHPWNTWARVAEAAILAWGGDGAHEIALLRMDWSSPREALVHLRDGSCHLPALARHATIQRVCVSSAHPASALPHHAVAEKSGPQAIKSETVYR